MQVSIDAFARTVLLSKRILLHALGHSLRGTIPDRIIAIHDIHNAVEWLLVAIHDFYAPQKSLPQGFDNLFKQANELVKATTGNSLSLKKDMERLANARNDAQHRADPPGYEELRAHYTRAEAFFRSALEAMNIGVSFDDLSLADMLSSDFILRLEIHEPVYNEKNEIIDVEVLAEELNVVERFREAELASQHPGIVDLTFSHLSQLLTLAEAEIARTMVKQKPYPGFGISDRNYGGLSSIANLMGLSGEFHRLFGIEVEPPLTRDGAIRQFYEAVSTVLLRMSAGIDLAEYHRFEWLQHKQNHQPSEISREDIQWALSFAIDALLKYQSIINEQNSLSRGIL